MALKYLIGFLFFMATITSCVQVEQDEADVNDLTILPSPNKVLKRAGYLSLDKQFGIVANVSDSVSSELASYLAQELEGMDGFSAYITDLFSTRKHQQSIRLEIIAPSDKINPEAYEVDLTSSQIKITAATAHGIFNGIQSVLQILNGALTGPEKTGDIRMMIIKDQPKILRRGASLSAEIEEKNLESLLDTMARYKLNTLVVSDDQVVSNTLFDLAAKRYITIEKLENKRGNKNGIFITENSGDLNGVYDTLQIKSDTDYLIVGDIGTTTKIDKLSLLFAAQAGWSGTKSESFAWLESKLR